MVSNTVNYIGATRAAMLTSDMRSLVAGIINRRGDGGHPVATPDGLAYFAVEYAIACIDTALVDLTDQGQKLAQDAAGILSGDFLGFCTRCGESLEGGRELAEVEPAEQPPITLIIHQVCRRDGDLIA